MNKHWYPQNSETHLDDKGVSIEFRTALEIYKVLLSNPEIISRNNGDKFKHSTFEVECKVSFIMKEAIHLGKEFCRKFNEINSKHETTENGM